MGLIDLKRLDKLAAALAREGKTTFPLIPIVIAEGKCPYCFKPYKLKNPKHGFGPFYHGHCIECDAKFWTASTRTEMREVFNIDGA